MAVTTSRFRLLARAEQAAFLALPWGLPLVEWPPEHFVEVDRGIGRHVVRFVELAGALYALKELPPRLAEREYRLLTALEHEAMPAVEAEGIVADRRSSDGEELESVLITRYLEYSLPYRLILGRDTLPAPESSIRAGMAELLVRLHITGFFWGDCSLSNALFRRDAGELAAYVVDTETSEVHDGLSDGQRRHDVDIAEENVVGELYDIEAELGRKVVTDPLAFAENVRLCYENLWDDLTRDEIFPTHEGHRLEERLR